MTAGQPVGLTRRNVRRGLLSSGLANLVALPLSLVVLPVILRKLSPADYGVWAAVSTVVVIGGLADLGVAAEITRRVAAGLQTGRARDSARRGLRILIATAVMVIAVGELSASGIVHVIFGQHASAAHNALPLLRVSLLIMAASLVASGLAAVLQGLQRSDIVNVVTTGSGVVSVILIVTTIGALKVWSLVLGAGVVAAVQLVAYGIRTHQLLPHESESPNPLESRYFQLSLLVLVPAVCNVIDWQLDKLLIAHFVGAAATGGYQIGSTIDLELRNVLLLPLGMMLPALADRRAHAEATEAALPSVRTVFYSLAGMLFGALVVLGPSLTNVWLGTRLHSANQSLQWLAVGLAINCATAPLYFHALANLWHKSIAQSAVCNAFVNATLSWSLVPWLGLRGPLLGSVLGNVVGFVALVALVRRRGFHYNGSEATTGGIVLASAIALAIAQTHLTSSARWVSGAVWCGLAVAAVTAANHRPLRSLLQWLR